MPVTLVDPRDPGFDDDRRRGGWVGGFEGPPTPIGGFYPPGQPSTDAYGRPVYGPFPLPILAPAAVAAESIDLGEDEVREVLPGSGNVYDVVWDAPIRVPQSKIEEYGVILQPRVRPGLPEDARPEIFGAPTLGRPIEEEPMADWGDLVDFGIDILQQRITGTPPSASGLQAVNLPPSVIPSAGGTMTMAQYQKCKPRRRRRRLLTPTDLSDLAALKTITGNNDALKMAVIKAIRR